MLTIIYGFYKDLYKWFLPNENMAEASLAAYEAAIGVAIALAVTAFSLRQARPHGPEPVET